MVSPFLQWVNLKETLMLLYKLGERILIRGIYIKIKWNSKYISASFVVTASIFQADDSFYTEELYHINFRGQILGMLPCLGKHPHKFCSAFIRANEHLHAKYSELGFDTPGWYLLFKDGHGGICCIHL